MTILTDARRSLVSMMLTLAPALAAAGGPGAHVHGAAALEVALDQGSLSITLDSPLDNLLGFEHAPRTDRQKQAAKALADTLRRGDVLFGLPAAAKCTLKDVQLQAPVLGLGQGEAGGEHASLQADYLFACAAPAALNGIDVNLFDRFRGLHKLDARVAGPRGQSAVKLTGKQRRLAW